MPLTSDDDLNAKYGGSQNQNAIGKKKRRKSKGRALEIEFSPYSGGIVQSCEPSDSSHSNSQKVIAAFSTNTTDVHSLDIINQLLPAVQNVLLGFFYKTGNRTCKIDEVVNFLKISDMAPHYKQMISLLNDTQLYGVFEKLDSFQIIDKGSKMILRKMDHSLHLCESDVAGSLNISVYNNDDIQKPTLAKCTLNTSSDATLAQTKSSQPISSDFTKSSHQYSNGTHLVGSEFETMVNSQQKVLSNLAIHNVDGAMQSNGDISCGQNIGLMNHRLHLHDESFDPEKRLILQKLKDMEKQYEERLSSESLKLKKSYKEILDLRLGKAKALANKRMGQAEIALQHANIIYKTVDDETVRSDIKQVIRLWEQILREYRAWHANLDRIVDGQKAQVDSNYRFDELALLTPPDNIPCAPQLPPNALKYFHKLESECNSCSASSELLHVIGPPAGFEKEQISDGHGRFGAIGQPTPSPQRKFTEAQINKLVEKTVEHFQNTYGSLSDFNTDQVRSVISELERYPTVFNSETTFPSVLSHVIKRVLELRLLTSGGNGSSQSSTQPVSCWASLSPEPAMPLRILSHHSCFETIHRVADTENQECKICLQLLAHGEKSIECPSCVDSYHYECGIKWLKQNSTCPNCRRLWSNPIDFPTLATVAQ